MLAREYCRTLVNRFATGAGVGAMLPVPGTSLALTAAEAQLVVRIAGAYGERFDAMDAARLVALTGAKNLGVRAVGELAGYVPVVGWVARPALYAASVKAVGDAVIRHFESLHPDAAKAS